MKMGIKEFRDKVTEVSLGDELVIVTHHGRRVGRYIPEQIGTPPDIDMEAWAKERDAFGRRWRNKTADWRERLLGFGIPPDEIAELDASDRC